MRQQSEAERLELVKQFDIISMRQGVAKAALHKSAGISAPAPESKSPTNNRAKSSKTAKRRGGIRVLTAKPLAARGTTAAYGFDRNLQPKKKGRKTKLPAVKRGARTTELKKTQAWKDDLHLNQQVTREEAQGIIEKMASEQNVLGISLLSLKCPFSFVFAVDRAFYWVYLSGNRPTSESASEFTTPRKILKSATLWTRSSRPKDRRRPVFSKQSPSMNLCRPVVHFTPLTETFFVFLAENTRQP